MFWHIWILFGDQYPENFNKACQEHKYTKIFVLPPWQEIYVSDNERYESFDEAQTIHNHLIMTYESYGYDLIEIPKESVENRVSYILNALK